MSNVVILDCGATNVRAIAVNHKGHIVASHHIRNETEQTKEQPVKHTWNFNQIWNKLVECCHAVMTQIERESVCAVSVTTFGVDGAPFDAEGNQIYPVISWKCSRTIPVMQQIEKDLERSELYKQNGIGDYSFNTLYKLKWLKDNEPEVYQRMSKFVFISSMLNYQLTGKLSTDRTMAGTSMLTGLDSGCWHQATLDYLDLTSEHFPKIVDAGEKIGNLKEDIAKLLNLPHEIPVISTGHDTQFALFGSGVGERQPFLSSGTWEILMARSERPLLKREFLKQGLTTEFDSNNALFNPAIQWLSSAVMEWVSSKLFSDIKDSEDSYQIMIEEGQAVKAGCNGVRFSPDYLPNQLGIGNGAISGISINTTRGEIYRAALESLAYKLRNSLESLSEIGGFKPDFLVLVGGGSKNELWNQIRADVLNLPLNIVEEPEATVIGAAMYAFAGAGVYDSANVAQRAMMPAYRTVYPGDNHLFYQTQYQEMNHA